MAELKVNRLINPINFLSVTIHHTIHHTIKPFKTNVFKDFFPLMIYYPNQMQRLQILQIKKKKKKVKDSFPQSNYPLVIKTKCIYKKISNIKK